MIHHDRIDTCNGFAIYHDTERHTFRVVGEDLDRHQVYSVMPSDGPRDGGRWFAPRTDGGLRYVARGYSRGYARRMFRKLSTEPA